MLALLQAARLERDLVPDRSKPAFAIGSTATTRASPTSRPAARGSRPARPSAPRERLAGVDARASSRAARARADGACAFFAAERAARRGRRAGRRCAIGEQPVWDADALARHGGGSAQPARAAPPRARNKGVDVRARRAPRARAGERRCACAIERADRALAARAPMAPMGFLVDVQPFDFADRAALLRRRARRRASSAFSAAVPIYARARLAARGLPARSRRRRTAPPSCSSTRPCARVGAAGSRYVTLGLAPLAGAGRAAGCARRAAVGARSTTSPGLRAFKAKLRPDAWEPIYLAHPPRQLEPRRARRRAGRVRARQLLALRRRDAACAARRWSCACWRRCWCRGRCCSRSPTSALVPVAVGAARLGRASTSRWWSRCSR